MITRANPDVGYFDESVFEAFTFSQVVRAGNTIYLSGIAPLIGTAEDMQVVTPGDVAGQAGFVLEILQRCLTSQGAGLEHLVAVTVYATDIDALAAEAALFQKWFGDHPPSSTWVEVRKLIHTDQLLELTATAVVL